jgi:hypothetical protein
MVEQERLIKVNKCDVYFHLYYTIENRQYPVRFVIEDI